jgi:ATP-dependent Zn protease
MYGALTFAAVRTNDVDNDRSPELPIYRGRLAILAAETAALPGGADLDLELLAKITCGFTANGLANLCLFAMDVATDCGTGTLSTDDFSEALEPAFLLGARTKLLEPGERRQAAYETAGQVLLAWRVYGVEPTGRVTILADRPGDIYAQAAPLDPEHNDFAACLDLALAGTVGQELAGVELPDEAECQPDRAAELARLCLAARGATLPAIEAEAQRLMDERRQGILRQLTGLRPQLDRLADILLREEGIEAADLLELLGSEMHLSA